MENIETLRQAARTAQSALYEAEAIQRGSIKLYRKLRCDHRSAPW